jgi:Leucine-rich repeat (LRR) protein
MKGRDRTKLNRRMFVPLWRRGLSASLMALASCQGFPGTAATTNLLLDETPTTVMRGKSPAEESQLKQHRLALQIKKAGGDITNNMALYPASTVVGVDLHHTQITDADLAQLKLFPNLRTVNLYGTHTTDAGLANLGKIPSLQTLHLGNTEVTDAGLESLQALPDLHELGLTHTKVTDQGLATVASMKGLTELTLSGSQISDAGLLQLESLSRLRKMVLIKTKVTKSGVERLQRALPDTHIYFG